MDDVEGEAGFRCSGDTPFLSKHQAIKLPANCSYNNIHLTRRIVIFENEQTFIPEQRLKTTKNIISCRKGDYLIS